VFCLELLLILEQRVNFRENLGLFHLVEVTDLLQLFAHFTREDGVGIFQAAIAVQQRARLCVVNITIGLVLLVDLLLELVDELFQVRVADVVRGPVWDGIELDAVGELHVCFDEGAELVPATEVCYCTRAETTEVKVVGIGGIIVGG